jgi:hypothetical protein
VPLPAFNSDFIRGGARYLKAVFTGSAEPPHFARALVIIKQMIEAAIKLGLEARRLASLD